MTRPAKPPVRYAYAVCNAQGKIASQNYRCILAIYPVRLDAQANCTPHQHVERVRVSVVQCKD